MTCAKCGAANAPGDAFCGSCGAYLEFAAEEAAEQTQVAGPAPGASPAEPSAVPAGPTAGPAHAGTIPAGAPAGPAPGAPADTPAGPTCAACGRVNPAGRRFCISCGERLPAGGGIGASTPAGAAAAAAAGAAIAGTGAATAPAGAPTPARPAGPQKPDWSFPTAPVPATAPTAVPAAASGGGGSRLPLIVGGLVLAVAVVVGAALVLGGGLGGATPAPSSAIATTSPAPTGEAPTAAPGETPAGSPTAAPTAAPTAVPTMPSGPAVGIKITSAKASSQQSSRRAPKYLSDGSPATAWKSASGKYEGSWIEVRFAPTAVTRLQLWAGWQADEATYRGNHRPRNVTVSFDGGEPLPLVLKDVLGAQRVDIPPELGIVRSTKVRITIIDTYPAKKTKASGSPTKEVAVSEIRIFGVPVTP